MFERREKIYEGELAARPSRQGKDACLLVTHVYTAKHSVGRTMHVQEASTDQKYISKIVSLCIHYR